MPSVGLSEGLDGPKDRQSHRLRVCQMVLRFGREKKAWKRSIYNRRGKKQKKTADQSIVVA
jgi:hypothetical protein